ncbi:hypothetical protein GCM10008956_30440 [Deinococcus arenae]|uniref:Uncharacterized protein n=1 Tax=Deinococcus arenae TaxID=1452751 RepID=A0A8H9GX87_9DEIO|nr:hypothetical protein [Deinococcus arenae]GGM52292.1 hypothetical protein GCM10008956_30440 [Deinococcus arenae]
MSLAPLPILLAGDTPAEGFTLTVDAAPGGYAGATLLSTSGPPVTLTLNGQPLTFPKLLAAGDVLVLQRTDTSGAISTVHALAPLAELPPPTTFTVTTDPDGFPVYQEAQTTPDADGYLTVTNATATDSEGYINLERTS